MKLDYFEGYLALLKENVQMAQMNPTKGIFSPLQHQEHFSCYKQRNLLFYLLSQTKIKLNGFSTVEKKQQLNPFSVIQKQHS